MFSQIALESDFIQKFCNQTYKHIDKYKGRKYVFRILHCPLVAIGNATFINPIGESVLMQRNPYA